MTSFVAASKGETVWYWPPWSWRMIPLTPVFWPGSSSLTPSHVMMSGSPGMLVATSALRMASGAGEPARRGAAGPPPPGGWRGGVPGVHHDFIAVLLGQILHHLAAVSAELGVLIGDPQRLEGDPLLLLEVAEEVEHHLGEVLVVGRGAEEPLEAAAGQRRRGGLGGHERGPRPLGDLAGGRRDRAVPGTDEGGGPPPGAGAGG